jgi:hypothetical protein
MMNMVVKAVRVERQQQALPISRLFRRNLDMTRLLRCCRCVSKLMIMATTATCWTRGRRRLIWDIPQVEIFDSIAKYITISTIIMYSSSEDIIINSQSSRLGIG